MSPPFDALLLAAAPGSWGVEPPPKPDDPPFEQILDEIATAGFDGTELGPLNYYPTEPAALREELEARGLRLAAAFVMEPLTGADEAVEEIALRTANLAAAAGAEVLVLIDGLDPDREPVAGRSAQARRLTGPAWSRLLSATSRIYELGASLNMEVAFHPHAGTNIEFEDEVDRLLAASPVALCLDTGHAVYAGTDPTSLIQRYSDRIRHVHLKDVDAVVLDRCRNAGRGFVASVAEEVFTPLGDGSTDLPAVARALREAGYEGWATFEQDRTTATLQCALDNATRSVQYARRAGF